MVANVMMPFSLIGMGNLNQNKELFAPSLLSAIRVCSCELQINHWDRWDDLIRYECKKDSHREVPNISPVCSFYANSVLPSESKISF